MKNLLAVTLLLLGFGIADDACSAEPSVKLFNGKDLTGWEAYIWDRVARKRDTDTPAEKVWTVADGVLKCKGRPVGYLRTKKEFENYTLQLEWRWEPDTPGGNSGLLVHTTTPEALGLWPKSIEVQLFRRNAGDFWVIGTDLDVENEEERKKGRRHLNLTNDSEKPIGEWNTMHVTCKGDEIIVKVNGDLVNHATNCTVTKGSICLQAEGAQIQFRNILLTPLK